VGTAQTRRLGLVLVLWASLLLLVFSGRMYTTDVLAQMEVAGSLSGSRPFMTVSGDYGWTVQGARSGIFVPHGLGFSILLVPAALAGGAFGIQGGKVVAALLNSGLSLVLLGFWYAEASRKYHSVPISRFILVAIGSMALVYGKVTFDVTAAAAAAMSAYYCFQVGRSVTAGALFGLAILIRTDSVLLFPLFIGGWRDLRRLWAGAIPFLLLILLVNWYRFGSPLLDGHGQDPAIAMEPFRGGIPGLLLSPGKGLLYYAPLCVLALFHQREWRLWTPFVLSLVFHGMLHDWTGGTGWGPRFLFTSLPFLLMPLCRKGSGGRIFWVVAVLGAAVCLPALWSNPSIVEQSAGADLFDDPTRQAVIWTYSSSPLFLAFRGFARGLPDVFGTTAAAAAGLGPWLGALLQWSAGVALSLFGVFRLRMPPAAEGEPA
jgi:hypothetical protein